MESRDVISALSALAQETRLAAFRALVRAHAPEAGKGGLAAGVLALELGVPSATLSFHLKEMAHAGLVTARREGRSIIYKANLDAMQGLVGYLLEDCCGGACGAVASVNNKKECA